MVLNSAFMSARFMNFIGMSMIGAVSILVEKRKGGRSAERVFFDNRIAPLLTTTTRWHSAAVKEENTN